MSNFSPLITQWYRLNYRELPWRTTKNPYFIWLSEIILQQTRVEQGTKYYLSFVSKFPTVKHLAEAEEKEILKLWQGLGYYSRARNLHYSARMIVNELKGQFPRDYNALLQLKGVGNYTAAAISSIVFNERKAAVDGNVYRVLSRVFDISLPIDAHNGIKEFQNLADELIPISNPGEHNQAVMELGALICKPQKPYCDSCPLNTICLALQSKTIDSRPVKSKKTKTRDRNFHYLVYSQKGTTILEKRTENDIWQNLYQFPLIEESDHETKVLAQLREKQVKESKSIIHILSHQRISAIFHHFDELPSEFKTGWELIKVGNLADYPIPRLIDKYLESHTL